jgi:hypothetical protein
MVFVKLVAIDFLCLSTKSLASPAPLGAKKACKFALKTVQLALFVISLIGLLIVGVPGTAAEFVKG